MIFVRIMIMSQEDFIFCPDLVCADEVKFSSNISQYITPFMFLQ